MREILFRGKLLDDSGWVRGFLVGENSIRWCDGYFGCEKTNGSMQQNVLVSFVVYPDTIGQFTGLTDKNGKKIFEGDIIECCSEGVRAQGTVQQRKDGMWIIYPAWQKHIMWGLCPDENMHTTVEVIGNIYDNPEMMEGN